MADELETLKLRAKAKAKAERERETQATTAPVVPTEQERSLLDQAATFGGGLLNSLDAKYFSKPLSRSDISGLYL